MSKPSNSDPKSNAGQTFRSSIAAAVLAGTIALGLPAPASAQTACGERNRVISELAQLNAETPKAIGLSASGTVIELLVSPNGDWTILATFPSHQTCLVATGAYWESISIIATGPAV